MTDYVTIDDARQHLRLDSDSGSGPDDSWLMIWIPAVSQAIDLWLRDPVRATYTTSAGTFIHPIVRAAALVELATQYRDREERDGAHRDFVLNANSTMLLSGLRAPQVK